MLKTKVEETPTKDAELSRIFTSLAGLTDDKKLIM